MTNAKRTNAAEAVMKKMPVKTINVLAMATTRKAATRRYVARKKVASMKGTKTNSVADAHEPIDDCHDSKGDAYAGACIQEAVQNVFTLVLFIHAAAEAGRICTHRASSCRCDHVDPIWALSEPCLWNSTSLLIMLEVIVVTYLQRCRRRIPPIFASVAFDTGKDPYASLA